MSSVPNTLTLRNGEVIPSYALYLAQEGIEFPDTVYVVGAGEKGARYIDSIPDNAFTIAANSLAHHPRPWSIMTIFDRRCVQYEYFNEFDLKRHKMLFYSDVLCKHAFMLDELGVYKFIRPDGFFPYIPQLQQDEFDGRCPVIIPGVLRGGLTVSGVNVQIALQQPQVERIVLCGVDFYGTGHWDGYHNPDATTYQAAWPWVDLFNMFIDYIIKVRNVRVESMSPTALEVQPYAG